MKLKFWFGMVVSVICVYLVFRNIEFQKVIESMRSVNVVFLALAMGLQFLTIWLRAERWKYLLAPIKTLTFRHLVPATMIGFMANNVLPARAGEFIRAYVIGKKERISKMSSFATIVIERIFDMMTMLGLLLSLILFFPFPQGTDGASEASLFSVTALEKVGAVSALFVVGLVVFLILLKEFPQKTTIMVTTLLRPFPQVLSHKALDVLHSFRMGLHVLRTGSHLVFVIFWSMMVWLGATLGAWSILWAFDLRLPFMSAIFITVATAFSAALPSSPGYVGPFHFAVKMSVLFFVPEIGESAAAGVAIIYHLVCIVPTTLAGIYFLWKENMSFAEIQRAEEEREAEDELEAEISEAEL